MKKHSVEFKKEIKLLGMQQQVQITYDMTTIGSEQINEVKAFYKGNLLKSVMKGLEIDSNVIIPKGTEIKFKYGLLVNGAYEYIDFGTYIVKSIEKQEDSDSYLLKCYDKLLYSMKNYEDVGITYPITVKEYIKKISNHLGFNFKNRNETFVNSEKLIPNELYLDGEGKNIGFKFRDVLDELAEVTASAICLNANDELELRDITQTNDTIDEEYLNDNNVNFSKKIVINSVVLSRAGEDNIYRKDDISVQKNGLYEIKIVDNQIMNQNNRDEFIDPIYNKLNGTEFYLNDFSSTGILYYDFLDRYNVKVKDKTYNCVMFSDEININQGLEEHIYTEEAQNSETDYSKADKTDRRINQVTLITDKHNKQIKGLITDVGDRSNKETSITADIDGLISKVEDIEALTKTIDGNGEIRIPDNSSEGKVVKLYIYGNNTVFDLFPDDNLFPDNNLYPSAGPSILIVKDKDGNTKEYNLGVDGVLKQKNNICDEYVLEGGKGKVIRRLDDKGNVLKDPIEEKANNIEIFLYKGENIITLKGYEAKMRIVYVPENQYTDKFATKTQMNSAIEQSAQKIDLNVNQKLENYSTTTEMNSAIDVSVSGVKSEVTKLQQSIKNLVVELETNNIVIPVSYSKVPINNSTIKVLFSCKFEGEPVIVIPTTENKYAGITTNITSNDITFSVNNKTTIPNLDNIYKFNFIYQGIPITKTIVLSLAQQGIQGEPGKDGQNGTNGQNGLNGKDGQPGKDGKDVAIQSTTPPTDKTQMWYDINTNTLKRWNGTIWEIVNDYSEELNQKLNIVDLGTKIEQNAEAVKVAWNQINQLIQFIAEKGMAELQIKESANNKLMSLNKNGQEFYENNKMFAKMGVSKDSQNNKYVSFSVPARNGQNIKDGMAWGVNTPDGKFYPIMYVKNFNLPKAGGEPIGELVLSSCDMVLAGIGTGIVSGDILLTGDPGGDAMYFQKKSTGETLLAISKSTFPGDNSPYISLLDNIMFFKNMAGSNSLRIGDGENPVTLTDDGAINSNSVTSNSIYSFGEIDGHNLHIRSDGYFTGKVTCNRLVEMKSGSRVEWKKDIKKFNKSALDIVNNTDIYEYRLKKDKATDKKRIGFVIGEGYNYTHEITDTDEEGKEIGVNNYSMNSVSFKAIQELHQIVQEQQKLIEKQNKRIEILENKIKGGK